MARTKQTIVAHKQPRGLEPAKYEKTMPEKPSSSTRQSTRIQQQNFDMMDENLSIEFGKG